MQFELTFQKQGNGLKNYRELGALFIVHWANISHHQRGEVADKRWGPKAIGGAPVAAR